jgi:hypothetical protein
MTVRDLKAALTRYGDDLPVILAHDAEGNKFSPLAADGAEQAWYLAEETWCGDRYTIEDYEDDENPGDEKPGDAGEIPAVFLWPIN